MRMRKILATLFAGVLLVGALVYYNFIDQAPVSGAEKGNRCPDFTAQTYTVEDGSFIHSEATFTLSQQIGKVCVVNFWETWCQACIEELPSFNRIQEEYGDKVEVIAVVGKTSTVDSALAWMNKSGWSVFDKESDWKNFSLTFAYLPAETCTGLGCGGMLPRTVIVDKSGIIAHEQDGSMTYEALKSIIDELL